jgi:hypothetical protein
METILRRLPAQGQEYTWLWMDEEAVEAAGVEGSRNEVMLGVLAKL